jgi:hypothetical protein
VTLDGVPAIGALPGVAGAYVATGHSCWGILNAPATVLSHLIAPEGFGPPAYCAPSPRLSPCP